MKTRLFAMLGAVFFSVPISLAQHSISGVVKNESGEPLVGAKVVLNETYKGTYTDADGKYHLTALSDGAYAVEVRYIGYERSTQRADVRGADVELNFTLALSDKMVEPVIVTAVKASE